MSHILLDQAEEFYWQDYFPSHDFLSTEKGDEVIKQFCEIAILWYPKKIPVRTDLVLEYCYISPILPKSPSPFISLKSSVICEFETLLNRNPTLH